MAERGDETIRHRSEEAGETKIDGPSPTFNFTKEVKNICKACNIDQTEKMPVFF